MTRLREVAPGVLTTSTLLVGGSDVLVVDPAWLPDELDGLAAETRQRDLRVIGASPHTLTMTTFSGTRTSALRSAGDHRRPRALRRSNGRH